MIGAETASAALLIEWL